MYTDTGTLQYQAPEMHGNEGYNNKVDMWSIGILAYQLLTGSIPFNFET